MTPASARPRQPPGGKKPGTDAATGRAARLRACRSVYQARVMRLSALLDKLGVHRSDVQLAKDYALHTDETLQACVDLTPAQRRCVIGQPNPLLAEQFCRLDDPLSLRAPPPLMALLTPRPVAVDDATARHHLAGLRGRWVRQGPAGSRVEIVIGPEGRASFRHFRNKRPDGDVVHSVLSIRNRREVLRRRAVTVQRYVYFRIDRDTFLLSGNPLHTATPIRSRTAFQLILAKDRLVRLAAGQCEVIDLSYLAAHAATCTWHRDAVTQVPVLRITYTLGRWKRRSRFFLVRSHLIHERLYQRRFTRR